MWGEMGLSDYVKCNDRGGIPISDSQKKICQIRVLRDEWL